MWFFSLEPSTSLPDVAKMTSLDDAGGFLNRWFQYPNPMTHPYAICRRWFAIDHQQISRGRGSARPWKYQDHHEISPRNHLEKSRSIHQTEKMISTHLTHHGEIPKKTMQTKIPVKSSWNLHIKIHTLLLIDHRGYDRLHGEHAGGLHRQCGCGTSPVFSNHFSVASVIWCN